MAKQERQCVQFAFCRREWIILWMAISPSVTLTETMLSRAYAQSKTGVATASRSPHRAVLPDGTTLELLAICENPNQTGRWWQADGTPIDAAPYERLERPVQLGGYEFLIRSDRTPDVEYRCEITRAGSLTTCKPVGANTYGDDYVLVYVARMPEAQGATDVQVAVALGEWKTNAMYHMFSCCVASGFAGGGVIFNPPQDIEGQACLVVAHTFDLLAARVVALGEDQRIHLPSAENVMSVRGMETRRCTFDLPTAKIREILFQTRHYTRVKFGNVSLRWGQSTKTRIAVDANEGPFSRTGDASIRDKNEKLILPVLDTPALTSRKRLRIGDKMPVIKASTLDGETMNLAQYRGKYVLLDFWATWCTPCLAEMPFLKDVYREFGKDERFVMIGVTLDRNMEAARDYVAKFGIRWPQSYLAQAGEEAQYGVDAIPACFLLGPDGSILAKDLRDQQIRSAIVDALKVKQ
jgi:thiol-disulfide isomerase/thioredoxin